MKKENLYFVQKCIKATKAQCCSFRPRKLDNANTLCLVYSAFDTYAILTKTHSAVDILLSEVEGMAGDQLNHPSALSSL